MSACLSLGLAAGGVLPLASGLPGALDGAQGGQVPGAGVGVAAEQLDVGGVAGRMAENGLGARFTGGLRCAACSRHRREPR